MEGVGTWIVGEAAKGLLASAAERRGWVAIRPSRPGTMYHSDWYHMGSVYRPGWYHLGLVYRPYRYTESELAGLRG